MSKLCVPYFKGETPGIEDLSVVFNQLPENPIDQISWKEFPYRPEVAFKIAYTDDAILINYSVEEKHLRVNNFKHNDPVYEDSCVEFFISFEDGIYYNLEFNAVGIALVGY